MKLETRKRNTPFQFYVPDKSVAPRNQCQRVIIAFQHGCGNIYRKTTAIKNKQIKELGNVISSTQLARRGCEDETPFPPFISFQREVGQWIALHPPGRKQKYKYNDSAICWLTRKMIVTLFPDRPLYC